MTGSPDYGRRRDVARRIRAHRAELADQITDDFLRRHPDWLDRYGDRARARGVEDARFHLDFLAGAVESGSPGAFADYGRWTAEVLDARGIDPAFVAENLEQVGDALQEVLDPEDREFVSATLRPGIQAAREVGSGASQEGDRATPERLEGKSSTDGDDGAAIVADDLALSRSLYVQSILQGDKRAAVTVVEEALRNHPVTAVYRRIVEEAQGEVGRLWARNEITVAREHMATAVSQYVLGELYSHLPSPERIVGRAVITGVEGEHHQLGANMVADLLEAEGWSVRFLGTQMPHRDIVEAVGEHDAQVVGVSATMLFNVSSVSNLIRDLRGSVGTGLRIVVGGRAFGASPELWQEIGADGAGGNLDEALAVFRELGT